MDIEKLKTSLRKRILTDITNKEIFKDRLVESYDNSEQRAEDLKSKLKIDVNSSGFEKEVEDFTKDAKEIAAEETAAAFIEMFVEHFTKIFIEEFQDPDNQ